MDQERASCGGTETILVYGTLNDNVFIRRDREMQLKRKLMEEEALSSGVSSPDLDIKKQRAAANKANFGHKRQMTANSTLYSKITACGDGSSSTG